MLQSALARQPLVIAGALGLIAGVLVAYQMTAPPALATPPPVASGAVSAAPDDGGIVFLDSRPAAPATVVAGQGSPAEPAVNAPVAGSGGFLRIVLMMTFLVVGLVAWYLTRRRQQGKSGGATKALSLIGTVKIAGRWQVALVKVPGKTLVLGATDKGLSLLSELDDDVALDIAERDELAARIRDDDTVAFTAHAKPDAASPPRPPSRVKTDPLAARVIRNEPSGFVTPPPLPSSEPFGRLLEQLTRGTGSAPSPVRERAKTDEALALRARLERHQPPH